MSQIKTNAWSLADIEQRTGLTREVMRKWELRYQFPQPQRGPRGQRQFSPAELHKLQLIARLLKLKQRIGALVPQSSLQLQTLLDSELTRQALSAPD